jgi:hypothetical protein
MKEGAFMLRKIFSSVCWVMPFVLIVLSIMAGTSSAADFYLRAEAVDKTMPTGEVVRMWGFALDSSFEAMDGGPATVPGPTLIVGPGDGTLNIHLDNNLTEPVSIIVPGQSAVLSPIWSGGRVMSFTTETPPGNAAAVIYTWNNLKAGTYLYQSGTNPAVQVQMGLYGAMKKDALLNQAYNSAATIYDSDVVLIFSEIDPVLHDAVAAGNYGPGKLVTSTVDYEPKYFLINGEPYYSGRPLINSGRVGDGVLLRFLNAGLRTHVPVIQGMNLTVIAEDGNLFAYPSNLYAPSLPAGKTMDAMINASSSGMFPLYDRKLNLTNKGVFPGGMLAYLNITSGYLISGHVMASGSPMAGVAIGLTGDATASAMTDSAGYYEFSGLSNGNYTLSPSKAGYSFAPLSIPVAISGADATGQDFTGTPLMYSISGTVTSGGLSLSGVTMSLSGAATATTTTDASGNYAFANLLNGGYTVTPSMVGYVFTPSNIILSLVADAPGQDFTANAVYLISGNITSGGLPFAGVNVALSGDATAETTTDALGNYSFAGLLSGTYTVTPSMTGYVFTPSNIILSLVADAPGQDFTANAVYLISGNITSGGLPFAGVNVALSGDATANTTTDASGNYSFIGLLNGDYTITPSMAGYSFTPQGINVTISGADITGQDFSATLLTYAISGAITLGGLPLPGVTVSLSGAATATTTTNASGNYVFANLLNGGYTVTPSMAGYAFTPSSIAVTIIFADLPGRNFTAAPLVTYSISGTALTSTKLPIPGATINVTGPVNSTVTTNSKGQYTAGGLLPGIYTITPSLTGFTFTPASKTAEIINKNLTGQNFTGTPKTGAVFSISGRAISSTGAAMAGVTVNLSGAATATTTTDGSGNYVFGGLANGTYTVTPVMAGYAFTPLSRTVTVRDASFTGQDFEGTAIVVGAYSISGAVVTSRGLPLSGVIIILTGASTATATTDAAGSYTIGGLSNGTYTVTPGKSGYRFTPLSRTVSVSGGNVTGQNFTGAVF